MFVGWGIFAMEDLSVCGGYLRACFGGAPLWRAADHAPAQLRRHLPGADPGLHHVGQTGLAASAPAGGGSGHAGFDAGVAAAVHRLSGGRQLQSVFVFPVLRGGSRHDKKHTADFSRPCSASSWADSMVWQVLLPDRERSDVENRTLAQWPEFSWESLKDGSYTAAVEEYFADQFPLRDALDGTEGPDGAAHRQDGVPRSLPLRRHP